MGERCCPLCLCICTPSDARIPCTVQPGGVLVFLPFLFFVLSCAPQGCLPGMLCVRDASLGNCWDGKTEGGLVTLPRHKTWIFLR